MGPVRTDPHGDVVPTTVNPVLLAAATNTVVCSRNHDENVKVGCGFKYSNLPKQIDIWVTELSV